MSVIITLALTAIIIVGLATDQFKEIFKLYFDSRLKRIVHLENIERLRSGYPPIGIKDKAKSVNVDGIIDMTETENKHLEIKNPNSN